MAYPVSVRYGVVYVSLGSGLNVVSILTAYMYSQIISKLSDFHKNNGLKSETAFHCLSMFYLSNCVLLPKNYRRFKKNFK